jgi:hypothetical protein
MLVGLVAVFSLALAGPALADLLVELGGGNNTYGERRCPTATNPDGDETVFGRGGNDVLRLHLCGDLDPAGTTPGTDADIGNGNRGQDRVRVDDRDIQDTASGGGGFNDTCVGDLDIGATATSIDDPPVGPGGGTGAEEDAGDTLDATCETKDWVEAIDIYSAS